MVEGRGEVYTIRQAAQMLNVTSRQIRYYCNNGLIRGVRRNLAGYRVFSAPQIEELGYIANLFQCGLTKKEVKTCLRGPLTQCKNLLSTKKRQFWQELETIRQTIDHIERQEELLEQQLANFDTSVKVSKKHNRGGKITKH